MKAHECNHFTTKGPSATGIKKPPLPYGLHVYKVKIDVTSYSPNIVSESQKSDVEIVQGSKNIAVSRSFVNYIANSEISRQLRVSTFLIIIVIVIVIMLKQ